MKNGKRFSTLLLTCLLALSGCNGGGGKGGTGNGGDEIVNDYGTTNEDGSINYFFTFHYQRSDKNYSAWELYAWGDHTGAAYSWTGSDSFGVYYSAPLSEFFTNGFDPSSSKLGFIVRSAGSWGAKDATDSDRFVKFNRLEPNENNVYHVYAYGGDKNLYSSANGDIIAEIEQCRFSQSRLMVILETSVDFNQVAIYEDKTEVYRESWTKGQNGQKYLYVFDSVDEFDITKPYYIDVTLTNGDVLHDYVAMNDVYKTDYFTENFDYDGELGAIYTSQHTIFRTWSPTSQEVKLRLYENGTPTTVDAEKGSDRYMEYIMDRKDNGIFEIDIWKDCEGLYYTYVVTNSVYSEKEIVDPYAKSAGVNGQRGMVVDFDSDKAKPDGWDDIEVHPYDKKSLVVYETHVADVTSSSTWGGTAANAKKFTGMYEAGTTYTSDGTTVTTGFDHIKELGVNAVQLMPIFDQSNDEVNTEFNWGYNPVNYNVLEGAYSTDPYDGYARIKEFRELVMAYDKAGINIIMDVVYNHLYSANECNFDVLAPGYYFRYTNDRTLMDNSGCGNETQSNYYMYHKFMVDSTTFWASTYKLGGFRFDLMALHDLDTMDDLTAECQLINPNIAIYGEPWTAGSYSGYTPANQANASKFQGYGAFNDRIRESLVKTNTASARGWATVSGTTTVSDTDTTRVAAGIKGTTPLDNATIGADKTVNYVSCHDNQTVYDRIYYGAGEHDDSVVSKMATLANAVVLTSKGTSFMLAGEEMLRTKGGDDNSYESGYEVNALDYSRKIKYPEVFENYKNLIEVKTTTSYLAQAESSSDDVKWVGQGDWTGSMLEYTFSSDGKQYIVYHRNGYGSGTYSVSDLSGYTCVVDTLGYINKGATFSGSYGISPYETIVACK